MSQVRALHGPFFRVVCRRLWALSGRYGPLTFALMRIIRFVERATGRVLIGAQRDPSIAELLDGALPDFSTTGEMVQIERILAPIVPADILCIGLNYRAHAAEQKSELPKNPMLFIKSGNSLADPDEPVPLPANSSKVDFEAELAVVIGRPALRVSRENALSHVFGYTIANDLSARDWQKDKDLNGGQFARGKSFDKFCPLGPAIVTVDEVPNPNGLRIRLRLNGQVMQDAATS